MNIVMNLTVLELLVAAVCLISAAAGIGTRHDKLAFTMIVIGIAMMILIMVTKAAVQ